jgi:3-dehydroquinate dehydratase
MAQTAPSISPDRTAAPEATKKAKRGYGSAVMLPCMLVFAWAFALSGTAAPGALAHDSAALSDLRWILYFAGIVFHISSVMHSVFRRSMAASIGWTTNGFELELAAVSLGLGVGCIYSVYQGIEAMTAISLPVIAFLFLAGVNHVVEIVRQKNYAPNNTLILIWDFGVSASLVALLFATHAF